VVPGRIPPAVRIVLAALLVASACAPKTPPAAPGPDRYPEFAFPLVPPDLQRTAASLATQHEGAWRALQAGDARAAERGFATVLKRRADFYPAEAGLAFVDLTRGNFKRAVDHFDRALARNPDYLPGLLGRGQALLRADRPDEALASFEAALKIDPTMADVRRRVETLRFRGLDEALAEARQAEAAGELDRARAAYEKAAQASPESGFLFRDLARVERRLDRRDEAIAHVRRATELDPSDGAAFLMLGDLLESQGDVKGAIEALERARELDAAPDLAARLDALRERVALAGLPEEFRAIPQSSRMTRGELAALIGVHLDALVRDTRRQPVLVTDVRNHWAQPWILAVARARVMEVFGNHTFQPRAVVRRGDLARAVSGVLTLIAQRDPALGKTWMGVRRTFSDLGPGNLYYPAASLAVHAGILETTEGGAFQAGRVVTGAEAADAVQRLAELLAQATTRAKP
jgi:tetratricopeptide (TPR) repeat protein